MNPIYVEAGKLDLNQRQIFDLKLSARFIVRGCAGSGKSSLALLRMKQLISNESKDEQTPFYYVAFVREFVECMRKEINHLPNVMMKFNDYAITAEDWKRCYVTDWTRKTYGIRARAAMYKEKAPSGSYRSRSCDLLIKVNKQPDYLFVDECQDLPIEVIDSFVQGVQRGISFYGDDDQHIMVWKGRSPVTLQIIHDRYGYPIYPLIYNYRLPPPIARFAEQICGRSDLSKHCKSQYHEKPFMISVRDLNDAYKIIREKISNRLHDVGVAFFTNEQVKNAKNALAMGLGETKVSGSWDIEDGDYSYLTETPIKVMTYEKIKGQQFETVFLFISGELSAEQVRRFYVGVTRAERFLYVLYTDPMPSILRQIPTDLYSKTDVLADFSGLYNRLNAKDGSVIDVGF